MIRKTRLGRPSWKSGAGGAASLRASVGLCGFILGILTLAVAFLWSPSSHNKWLEPADALPSFAAQVGVQCSVCHVGGFGPQLTPFGMVFKANGYTQGGGTSPWSHIPFDLTISPSFQTFKTELPAPPDGYSTTNSFFNLVGDAGAFWIAAGHSFDGQFGIGGFEQLGFNITPNGPLLAFESGSDLKITKPFTLGSHSLLLGLDFTNQPTGGDPYNTLYNGFEFPFLHGFIDLSPAASTALDRLGTTVAGLSLYAFYDNSIYVEAGLYQTWSSGVLSTMNISPSDLGTIAGSAPYFRIAWQHPWGPNFLEVGAMFMDTHVNQVPDALDPTAQDEYVDFGFDATYQRAFGADLFTLTGNILFENQMLASSFASGLAANPSNYLTHFRVAAAYYWNNTYGLTLAYESITGSTDAGLFAPAPLTGSANGSPNSQTLIAQVDWTPFGHDTTHAGYPWLNVRVGLQYRHYLVFNGGTDNYDGFGRNASDNDFLMLFTWWAF